ncbi:hypothetical protein [Nonomuraea sp. NPDC049695]|uniref:DUF4097 family beta strand repeat-containing protein n=1 Tax=Nonomuraea sp. NPDC049695 TaxID=3154734 RepID=UPI0034488DC5
MKAAWLAAGAVATAIALVISSMLLWRGFARARMPTENSQKSIALGAKNVRIKVGKGSQVDLMLLPGQAGTLLIERSLRWSSDRPNATETWDARSGTLRLDAACSDDHGTPVCQAEYVVFVPPETDIEASTTTGELAVNEVFGNVRLSSVSGVIRAEGISGSLWARTGTGNVDASGLDSDRADVEVGSGEVSLSFVNAPTAVKAVVRTTGNVDVTVPTAAYQVMADGHSTNVDVKQNPESSRKIVAKAPRGIVSICCQ